MNSQKTIWGFHARIENEQFFIDNSVIGIGWSPVGSLIGLTEREQVKEKYRAIFPDHSNAKVSTSAGQLYRFANEAKKGDLIAMTRKGGEKEVCIGEITGDYFFDAKKNEHNPHLCQVKWLKSVRRELFSQGCLYELGSALTLFQVKEYGGEILAALHGKTMELPADEAIATESVDYEQQALDFAKKQLLRYEKGHGVARLFGHLLEILGYHTEVSSPGKDGGVDIVAYPDELGVRTPRIKVQCKSGDVKAPEVRDLHGTLNEDEQGIIVTLGKFTPDGRQFAQSKGKVQLYDGDRLVELVLEHYEELDSSYKALMPLKRVYVPDISAE